MALVCVLALVALVLAVQPSPTGDTQRGAKLPLAFVPNAGQTDSSVRFVARDAGNSFYFTSDKVALDFRRGQRGVALELRFRGANSHPQVVAERRGAGRVSYIAASERHANLATYEQVRYRNLWPGIDMVFRGQGGALKYEFLVRPGADPRDIRLIYAGADSLRLAGDGALSIATPLGILRDAAPTARQGHRAIDARYTLSGASFGFAVEAHDRSRPLMIDPGLGYSTYLGGEDDQSGEDAYDYPNAIDVDAMGNAYVVGDTNAVDFPITPGAYDTAQTGGPRDGFVTKLNPDGGLVYSTYLGSDGNESLNDVAVDESGNAYVVGGTDSGNFPTTEGAYRRTGPPEFETVNLVVKLSPDGSDLEYSTFIGLASMSFGSIDVLDGRAYVGGLTSSPTYPTTPGAFDTSHDGNEAYVTKLSPTGSALEYSTYFNGALMDIAVNDSAQVFMAGQTSGGLPTTPGAYDTTYNFGVDAFAAKLGAGGANLIFSTYLGGGAEERARAIDFDAAGNAYITGRAENGFPTTPGSYAPTKVGNGFAAKFDPAGASLLYSTYLAGDWAIGWARGIDVDPAGFAWIAGYIEDWQPPLQTTPDAYDSTLDGTDEAYVVRLTPSGDSLAYSTYLGGSSGEMAADIKLDALGNAYVVGNTYSTDFPITPGAADPVLTVSPDGFNEDGFVTKFDTAQFSGYARPKGATPLYVSLVTAYEPCTAPNREHGPPLAFGSCSPTHPTSGHLVPGTADVNGKPPRNEGYLVLRAIPGVPSTPADEADASIEFFSDDIFTRTPLADYTGELRASFTVRATDRNNAPSPTAGTTQDFQVAFSAPCTPNPDDLEGSACALSTTVDALIPGAIAEGKRSVWRVTNVRVFDGGADGDADTTADNTLFATQGLFIP